MTLRKLGVMPRYRPGTPSWEMMYLNWPTMLSLGFPSVVATRKGRGNGQRGSAHLSALHEFVFLESVIQTQPCACMRVRIRARG